MNDEYDYYNRKSLHDSERYAAWCFFGIVIVMIVNFILYLFK